jgi:hypothetical protein
MALDVTAALRAVLAGNRGPDPDDPDGRVPPDYGVRASLIDARLELELTFRAGAAYCCMEIGCHVGLHRKVVWARLRDALGALGVDPPALEAHVIAIVEDGARSFDLSRPDRAHPGRHAWRAADAQRYDWIAREADATG